MKNIVCGIIVVGLIAASANSRGEKLKTSAREYHVSVTGNDASSGDKKSPLKTISAAAAKAQPGDTITVHEGIYRERINPPRGGAADDQRIVYQAAPGEKVVIKGSERVTGWKKVDGDTWMATLPNSFFGDFNPYNDLLRGDWYEAKRPYHTGAVYLDGHWLHEAPRKSYVIPSEAEDDSEDSRPELMNVRGLRVMGKNDQTLPAAQYTSASAAVETVQLPDGQTCVGRMTDGAVLTYEIDFGEESRNMALDAASPLEGGLVEIRKGDAAGELLGAFDIGFTAEWTSFQSFHTGLNGPISGKHTVALVFKARSQMSQEDADTAYWFAEVDAESTTIWAQFKGVDPNQVEVEINVRQSVFYPEQPGMNYITVQGFTLEQAAAPWSPPTAEQIGLLGTHWSKGWIIESNTIRYSTCAGVSLGKGSGVNTYDMLGMIQDSIQNGWSRENIGGHVVRNNHIYHCGQNGIVGSMGSAFSTIVGNEIHDIKKHHQYGGCESAGIKLHGAVDVLIRDNHVYNCEHWGGIWLDWMGQGARLTGNLLHDNSQDLMFEVNHGPHLVDNNILLSGNMTEASGGGAYVHNLWCNDLSIWPDLAVRLTTYFRPHSTDIIDKAAVNQDDDRFFNNIFARPNGTSAYDEHQFKITAAGNVFVAGAKPSARDKDAVVADGFDPSIKLTQKPDGWWLEMRADPAWQTAVKRALVTSELLGKSAVSGAPFENRDGTLYRIDADYFGGKRDDGENPAPGPFRILKPGKLSVRVWPK